MTETNQTQIDAAAAILKQFTKSYGTTASDTMLANAVYSMLAVTGGRGEPSMEYRDAVALATNGDVQIAPAVKMHEDGSFTIPAGNILGLPEGTYMPEGAMAELPNADDLAKMTKKKIDEQAQSEGFELSEGNKDEMIAELLKHREGPDLEPEDGDGETDDEEEEEEENNAQP